jgi:ADP-ribose pyrophosphatase
MQYEYRYPTGQILLSPPAGLIDPEDRDKPDALRRTTVREIFEETGVTVKDTDRLFVVNPMLFSSPGFTDECNALICAVVAAEDDSEISQEGAEGSEIFTGYELLTEEEAGRVLREGRDANGNYYSVYTWAALIYFVSGMWKNELNR